MSRLLLALCLLCWPLSAQAQEPPCVSHEAMLQALAQDHGEHVVSRALTAVKSDYGPQLVETLATDTGSTWSIVVTSPNGKSCLLAAGTDWRPVKDDGI